MRRRPTATIQVLHQHNGALDRHNNPTKTFSDPDPTDVWVIAPLEQQEPRPDGRPAATITGWKIYGPPELNINPEDRVILPDGSLCEVIGEVAHWGESPHTFATPGRTRCTEVTIRKYTG